METIVARGVVTDGSLVTFRASPLARAKRGSVWAIDPTESRLPPVRLSCTEQPTMVIAEPFARVEIALVSDYFASVPSEQARLECISDWSAYDSAIRVQIYADHLPGEWKLVLVRLSA